MARKLGFSQLQKAVYSRLTTNALTSGYKTFVYVPAEDKTIDISMPYNVIKGLVGGRSASFTTRDTEAEENVIEIHTWSDYKGDKECAEMQNNIIQAITGSALSIDGYDSPYLALFEYGDIIEDDTEPAKIVRHGILRFSFHMAPAD